MVNKHSSSGTELMCICQFDVVDVCCLISQPHTNVSVMDLLGHLYMLPH